MSVVKSYIREKMSAILTEKKKLYAQELEKATKAAKTALREPIILKDHQADSNLFPDINLSGRIHTLDKLMRKADEAPKKLENGTYGFCKCGKAIPLARLEAVPFTEYCLDCKTKTEDEDTIVISGIRQRISRTNHVITL
ncbi:MAG: TraR/DksA C4-type zinc finger protein [bacterium]